MPKVFVVKECSALNLGKETSTKNPDLHDALL